MGVAKASKLRWKRLPKDARATCFSEGCTNAARSYCKRADCRRPFCDACKGAHFLRAHTAGKLVRRVGALNIPGFEALPYERKIELLALIAKIRGLRQVDQSDVALLPSGEYVAWATIHNELLEKRATRLESALQDLYVDIKTSYSSATPPRR